MIDIKVPSPGESITEVEIGNWLVKDGDFVEMDQEMAEINSDKATLTVNAEADGVVKILFKAGTSVKVGQVIASIDTSAAAPAKKAEKVVAGSEKLTEDKKPELVSADSYAKGAPSVSASKMIGDKGLSQESIEGTGRGGRITKTDVLNNLDKPAVEKIIASTGNGANTPAPLIAGNRNQRKEKLSLLRRKIASRLVSVKNETAMLTTFNEVDMFAIMELRKKYKDKFKEVQEAYDVLSDEKKRKVFDR